MDRRMFIDAMTTSLVAAPLVAIAQKPELVRRQRSPSATMTPSSIIMPINSSTKYGLPSALVVTRSRSAAGAFSSRASSASVRSRLLRRDSGAKSIRWWLSRPLHHKPTK